MAPVTEDKEGNFELRNRESRDDIYLAHTLFVAAIRHQVSRHTGYLLRDARCGKRVRTASKYRQPSMSSPPDMFRESSPAEDPGAKRSRFTYRHLSQLASYATSSPLRVIAHLDLDCFYAQCEMIRLQVSEDQPLAVQQW